MSLKEQNAALLLINMQKGFDDEAYWGGNRNNKDAEKNASMILNKWRTEKLPVFHIIHSSQNPESGVHESHMGFEIKDEVKPIAGEPVIQKKTFSAFVRTDLKERLDKQSINTLVMIGLATNLCVSSSVRMAVDFGFETLLISDATATFDRMGMNGEKYTSETMHQTTLANLHDEFAQVIDTKKLLELV